MNRRLFLQAGAAVTCISADRAAAVPATAQRRFQLGCVTYELLKDMDLEAVIQTAEKAGLAAVELRTGHKHGVEPSLDASARARVRERFARAKVRLLSYGTTCEFQSPDDAARRQQVETARAFVDLAHDTGAIGVKVRPNGIPNGATVAATVPRIAAGLREVAEYGQSKGIEIWMEVHGRGTMEPPTAAEILKTAGHPNLGACWNSNPTDVENGSVRRSFALLRPYLRSAHINELYSAYPWRELFQLMRESGYDRYSLAEVPQSPEPDRFLRYYRALWELLSSPV